MAMVDELDAIETVPADALGPAMCDPNKLEVASVSRVFRQWFYRTRHDLSVVLRPGYFNSAWEHGLKLHDRIAIAARDGSEEGAQYADAVVVQDQYRPRHGDKPGLDLKVREI